MAVEGEARGRGQLGQEQDRGMGRGEYDQSDAKHV